MADLYSSTIGGGSAILVAENARKLIGDGAAGAAPYTALGTPKLKAVKIVSASVDFSSTANYLDGSSNPVNNGAFYKAVIALQEHAEVYYVGAPTNSGANQFVALLHDNKTDKGDGYGESSSIATFDGSYENVEEYIASAIGASANDITISEISLTGLTFA